MVQTEKKLAKLRIKLYRNNLARSSRESPGGLSVRKHEDSRHKTSSHGGEAAGGGHGGDRTHKVTHIITCDIKSHL